MLRHLLGRRAAAVLREGCIFSTIFLLIVSRQVGGRLVGRCLLLFEAGVWVQAALGWCSFALVGGLEVHPSPFLGSSIVRGGIWLALTKGRLSLAIKQGFLRVGLLLLSDMLADGFVVGHTAFLVTLQEHVFQLLRGGYEKKAGSYL